MTIKTKKPAAVRAGLFAGVGPLALACAMPAFAQAVTTAPPPPPTANSTPADAEAQNKANSTNLPPAADAEANPEQIVVTGSRIRSPNNESPVPVAVLSGQEFFKTGSVSVGDRLSTLPNFRSSFTSQNSTQFLGTAGLNLLDLRGLGTQRTLTLVNGRRFVAGDILNNAVSPDTNNFPADLIQDVQVTTGGSSAVYGSDAIAGVVNFVLKQDFEGLQMRGKAGISTYGDGANQQASILAGKNFADGRGNITGNFEFAHQTDYYGSDRGPFRTNHGFVVLDSDPAGATNGSDGVPDRRYFTDIRSATIAPGGLVNIPNPGGACGRDPLGAAYNCTALFQTNGQLVPQTGERIGLAPNGSYSGGNGSTSREGRILALVPRQDRYTGNLLGHFEVSRAFVPFFEATYTHQRVTGSTSGPAFYQGSTIDGNLERPRLDNPFLTAQARSTIAAQLVNSINQGINPGSGAAYATPADQAAALASVAAGTYRFRIYQNLTDLGVRNEEFKRDTFRIVGGVRGDFAEAWHYEVSGNYGQFKEKNTVQGNLNVQRFLLALDSGRNAAGQIVCRSQINPAFGAAAENGTTYGDIDNRLPADISACVPLNPFGQGNISSAARNYVVQDTVARGKITQTVASASVSGDTSQWFELPGGPVGIAVGGEYRRETAKYTNDPLVRDGYTFYNALPELRAPSFVVKEAFAELRVPILRDTPFFQELTVTGAGRYADYKGATGSVYAYNTSLRWKPIQDFLFRASYARSVRAPNLTERFTAETQNFAPGFVDPCSARNIATGTANRVANCAAQGIPASYDFVYTQSLEIRSGGNPGLKAEKSNSYTLGGLFTPRFIPGLSLSVDYFNIKVKDTISSVDAQTIANQCYDQTDLNNSFCSLFQRAGAAGTATEQPYQIIEGSLLTQSFNFAKLKTAGIDVSANYNHRFTFGRVAATLNYTRTLQRNDNLDPTDPSFQDVLLGEVGFPKDAFTLTTDFTRGKATLSYRMRFIGKQYIGAAENYISSNGNPPQNVDFADRTRLPSVFYHNVILGLDVSDRFNVYAGVDNLTNRQPPFGLTGVGTAFGQSGTVSGIYDNRGRYFYTGFVAKF